MFDGDIISLYFIKFVSGIKFINRKEEEIIEYFYTIYYKDNTHYKYSIKIKLDNIIKNIEQVEFFEDYTEFKTNYDGLVSKLLKMNNNV